MGKFQKCQKRQRITRSHLTGALPPFSLMTAPIPSEAGWSAHNLPAELFRLEPPADWGRNRLQDLFVQGQTAQTNNRPYKAFSIPHHISVNPETWRLVMYGDRTDPRLTYRDLVFRMHPDKKHGLLSTQTMSMQRTRCRDQLGLACWVKRTEFPSLNEMLKTEQYSLDSVRHNTTLPVRPWGLMRPVLEPGTFPVTPLPLDTFTGTGRRHNPSPRLKMVFKEIGKLQDLAFDNGYPHWIFLPNCDKPDAWIDKARAQHRSLTGPNDMTFPEELAIPKDALTWIKECVVLAASGQSGMVVPNLETLPSHARLWVGRCIHEGQTIASNIATKTVLGVPRPGVIAPASDHGMDEGYKTGSNHHASKKQGEDDKKEVEEHKVGLTSNWEDYIKFDDDSTHNVDKDSLAKRGVEEDVRTNDMEDKVDARTKGIGQKSQVVEADEPAVASRVFEWLESAENDPYQLPNSPPRTRKRMRGPHMEPQRAVKRPRTLIETTYSDQPKSRKRALEPDPDVSSSAKRIRMSNHAADARPAEPSTQPELTHTAEQIFEQRDSVCTEILMQSLSADINMPYLGLPEVAEQGTWTQAVDTSHNMQEQHSRNPFMEESWDMPLDLPQEGLVLCNLWPDCGGFITCPNCNFY